MNCMWRRFRSLKRRALVKMDGIVVDTNAGEDSLFNALSERDSLTVRRERLDVGDVILRHSGHTVIVERKKTQDLASSIGDGRYHEQKARQLSAVAADESGKTRVVWIVEGQLTPLDMALPGGMAVRSIEYAIMKTTIRDAIPVLRAADGKALADLVAHMFSQLASGGLDTDSATQKRVAEGYAGVVSVKKAKNSDAALTWKMMLATVNGLSMTKANSLVERWPSPMSLAKEIDGLDRKRAIAVVAAVKTNNKCLGPAVGGRLVDVFHRTK